MRQYIGYLWISRRSVTESGENYCTIKVKLSLCFNFEGVVGSGGIAPRILGFGIRRS
jgi:hypothetical protein